MELRLPLEMSPGREAACRAVFGTWGFFRTMHGKTAPSCGFRRGVRASGSYQEGTGKSGSYGMWNHPRGHVWNVFVTVYKPIIWFLVSTRLLGREKCKGILRTLVSTLTFGEFSTKKEEAKDIPSKLSVVSKSRS